MYFLCGVFDILAVCRLYADWKRSGEAASQCSEVQMTVLAIMLMQAMVNRPDSNYAVHLICYSGFYKNCLC